jgi:hypothetical protein
MQGERLPHRGFEARQIMTSVRSALSRAVSVRASDHPPMVEV